MSVRQLLMIADNWLHIRSMTGIFVCNRASNEPILVKEEAERNASGIENNKVGEMIERVSRAE
jgi:hypothetical protein